MLTMSRTEAIPFESMKEGMIWDWVTFPDWLDTLDRIPKGVNALSYVPLAPLMIWTMGLEAAKSRRASDDEILEMQRLLDEAMDAGACGWATQRLGVNSVQADYDGTPMVTDIMSDNECLAMAEVLKKRDEGFIQITQFTGDIKKDLAFQAKLAATSGRPVLHNIVVVSRERPDAHLKSIKWLEDCNARGERVFGQGATMRAGFAFTLEGWNLYDSSPSWNEATTGTREERKTVGEMAEAHGKHPIDAMLDLALETDLAAEFLTPDRGTNADHMAEMIFLPYTIPGVSDGGAHTKFFTGGSYTTDFLTWLVRDTEKLTLEEAHYRLSMLPAHAAGFKDRGFLREGAPADIVAYDLDNLAVTPEWTGEIAYDFPGGEWRRIQRAEGYRWILVNGEVTFEDGRGTSGADDASIRLRSAQP